MEYFQLWYSGGYGKDLLLFDYLYKDANYYLKRKFDRFQENSELTLDLKNSK